MVENQHPAAVWRKGSQSMANGTCVEVATVCAALPFRDSAKTVGECRA